jgi:hypothetical protein
MKQTKQHKNAREALAASLFIPLPGSPDSASGREGSWSKKGRGHRQVPASLLLSLTSRLRGRGGRPHKAAGPCQQERRRGKAVQSRRELWVRDTADDGAWGGNGRLVVSVV